MPEAGRAPVWIKFRLGLVMTSDVPYSSHRRADSNPVLSPQNGYFVELIDYDQETRQGSSVPAEALSDAHNPLLADDALRHRPPPISLLPGSGPSSNYNRSSSLGYFEDLTPFPTGNTLINDDRNASSDTLKVHSVNGGWPGKDRGENGGNSARTSATEYDLEATTHANPSYGSKGYAPLSRSATLLPENKGIFERPSWPLLCWYILLCFLTYAVLRLVAFVATNNSLFWARTITSLGCGLVGFSFAYILNIIAGRYLAACTWARVIHRSKFGEGIAVRDLAGMTNTSPGILPGLKMLFGRMRERGADRSVRASYDHRPWSLFSIFFLLLVTITAIIPFLYGRVAIIDAVTIQQSTDFNEVFVWGELSSSDLVGAATLGDVFKKTVQTWTLAPFASLTDLPSAVSFIDKDSNHTVYFAESYASQLRSDGSALGIFDFDAPPDSGKTDISLLNLDNTVSQTGIDGLIQFPKWGIRIQCAKIPDPTAYIIPVTESNLSYIFVPSSVLRELFKKLGLPYDPNQMAFNVSSVLVGNDTLPDGADASSIVAGQVFSNNGVAHSFFSTPADGGESGERWVEIEIVSVRLNTTYTPNGTFPVYGDAILDANGAETRIGYDAAVCIEAYEPWVVETFNGTGVPPSSIRLLKSLSANASLAANAMESTDGWNVWGDEETKAKSRLHAGEDDVPSEMNWTLNSTGKMQAFAVAHDNSINQMVKDNGRDYWFVPSPLTVSFTNGTGPSGYTELSAEHFASARAVADATNVLPFLAGTGPLAARHYPSKQLARVYIDTFWFLIVTGILLVTGLIAGCCVPRLPLSVPHRGFDLFSWLAVLHGDEMIMQLPVFSGGNVTIDEKMTVEEIEEKIGDIKVKYKV